MSIKSRNKVSVNFSMSSLTDIVFLLLIFFIILSTLVNPYGEKVDLPNSSNRVTNNQAVTITITKELLYYVNDLQVDPSNIENLLVKECNKAQNKNALLKVDETVPTGFTINMFALARNNGINMIVATKPS